MISLQNYIPLVRNAIPQFQQHPPNPQQESCLLAPINTPLMIVAGPGSGKTTVLVLRALRLVFVESIMPENIMITTFTRKAASEIRSRLIEWGIYILNYLQQNPPVPVPNGFTQWVASIDINRFITGTLDSICEDTLSIYRDPGDVPPVLVEGFVGNALLARNGMFPAGIFTNHQIDPDLLNYLTPFTRTGEPPRNFGETVQVCRIVIDRLIQDQVNLASFINGPNPAARQLILNILDSYRQYMNQTNRMDFAGLEEMFLNRLTNGRLQRFISTISAVLIDEYQDSNPLQESIYFEIIRQVQPSFTVVGDDDQSLYRFRGATVELFCNFPNRLSSVVPGLPPVNIEYLVDNYRSTPEIVNFFNNYIACDQAFTLARLQPPKPQIIPQIQSNNMPILGLFRPTVQQLAHDLANFLFNVFRGPGLINVDNSTIQIARNPNGGDFGDAVLLADQVREFATRFRNNPPRERLPFLLRQELSTMGIGVFNPRGQALRDIREVQQLLGLILICIDDPQQTQLNRIIVTLRNEARTYLPIWCRAAEDFINLNPLPNAPRTLRNFVNSWQNRINQAGGNWPNEWPILDLCYKLITWMPFFQDDPEGQVYLEAVSRCIAQAATFSTYRSNIIYGNGRHDIRSIERVIWDIMVPLAEASVEVDEDIMPHVPRNHLQIMTIHQAKGLEFPLVIVDIASDFNTNNQFQRFRRFPDNPGPTQRLEEDMAQHCSIGQVRTLRNSLDRTFDDLRRLYYVAFSRPQSLLLLVGIDRCLRYSTTIRHIATFWRSDGNWAWQIPITGRPPTMVNNHPLRLI